MYKCHFPNCNYLTENRFRIHFHHIKCKELKGNNKKYNILQVCPNHHCAIFSEDSSHGIHSIFAKDSIIVKRYYYSTNGRMIEYIQNNENYLMDLDTKEIIKL